jgi:hypothetical protein
MRTNPQGKNCRLLEEEQTAPHNDTEEQSASFDPFIFAFYFLSGNKASR